MVEVVVILAVAAMSVVFGLLTRQRRSCGTCDPVDDCAGCSLSSESNHART